jgi:alpha-1,6-mannosyltransferase
MKNALGTASALIYLMLIVLHKGRFDFWLYFWGMAALFAFYLYGNIYTKFRLSQIIFWAVVFNFLFIFYLPVLSDDVYRFIWDGNMTINGQNPYLFLPSEYAHPISGLFEKLNSPNYYSLYPPLNQHFFAIAAWFGKGSIMQNIIGIRLVLICAGIITVLFVYEIANELKIEEDKKLKMTALFAFNPFVIVETAGNLHFEGLMLMFILSAYFFFLKYKSVFLASIPFGMAVSIKLIPLILLPLIWKRLGFIKGFQFMAMVLVVNILFFVPFYETEIFSNVLNSMDLYFHKFEFNASLYYVLRELGYYVSGFNMIAFIGPGLALFSLITILRLSFKREELPVVSLYVLTTYLLCSTTVHPWYLITLIGVSLFTDYRFPIVWSFLVAVSYYAYQFNPIEESLTLVFLEYAIVLTVFFVEWKHKKPLFLN